MTTAAQIRARDAHLAEIERVSERLAAGPLARLGSLRRAAAAHFAEVGFPGPRDEAWRQLDLRSFLKATFQAPDPADLTASAAEAVRRFTFDNLKATRLVFVNGRHAPTLSDVLPMPSGATVGSLCNADDVLAHLGQCATVEQTPFVALNTALFEDGAFLAIPAGVTIEQPIHVLHLTVGPEPIITCPRLLVVAGDGARATVIESFAGHDTATHFTDAVSEFAVAPRARIEHLRLQREGDEAFHVAAAAFHLSDGGEVHSNSVMLGAQMTRSDVTARLDGEGARCTLNGLNMVGDHQRVDTHTLLDHAAPTCTSQQRQRSVLDGHATAAFRGRILVRQGAQGTDAEQSNRSLLLSDGATAHTQPNLEIFADDVKCAHGATVGALDETSVFYLRTRGIGEAEARALLTFAFANEIIRAIEVEPIRRQLEAHLFDRFHREG